MARTATVQASFAYVCLPSAPFGNGETCEKSFSLHRVSRRWIACCMPHCGLTAEDAFAERHKLQRPSQVCQLQPGELRPRRQSVVPIRYPFMFLLRLPPIKYTDGDGVAGNASKKAGHRGIKPTMSSFWMGKDSDQISVMIVSPSARCAMRRAFRCDRWCIPPGDWWAFVVVSRSLYYVPPLVAPAVQSFVDYRIAPVTNSVVARLRS